MVELNGALSNPFERDNDLLFKLFLLKRELLARPLSDKRRKTAAKVPSRTRVPVVATITQVLELANDPLSVKSIHQGCERLLGRPCSTTRSRIGCQTTTGEAS